MATSVTSTALVLMYQYDNNAENQSTFEEVFSTSETMKWGEGRVIDHQSRNRIGFDVSPYITNLRTDNSTISGITNINKDGMYVGLKREGEDSNYLPLFKTGQYTFKNDKYVFQGVNSVFEKPNFTSLVMATETSIRHLCDYKPSQEYPIKAQVFKRNQNRVDTVYDEYIFVDEFNQYAEHTGSIFDNDGKILWSRVDTSVKEFMLDRSLSDSKEFVFNVTPGSEVIKTPLYSLAAATEAIPALNLPLQSVDSTMLLTEHYPVSDFNFYHLDGGGNFHQWTSTTLSGMEAAATSDFVYYLNENLGEIFINTAYTSNAYPGSFYTEYVTSPAIQYSIDNNYINVYEANEVSPKRIVSDFNQGSFIYSLKDLDDITDIKLSVSIDGMTEYSNSIWKYAFYGNKNYVITITAKNSSTEETVESIPVKVTPQSSVGKILGVSTSTTFYTDVNGEIKLIYNPPGLGDNIGIKNLSRDGANTQKINIDSGFHYFENNPSEIYLYTICKDDPLIGRTSTTTSFEGTIEWDSTALNGRKKVLYIWDTSAKDPSYNHNGAFVAMRPASIDETSFTFPQVIPEADPSDNSNNIGGYWIAGSRKDSFNLEIDLEKLGMFNIARPASKQFHIEVSLSDYSKGEYVQASGNRYPFGWRLPGNLNVVSQLGGALYLNVNPVAGEYDILFESTSVQSDNPPVLGIQFYVGT